MKYILIPVFLLILLLKMELELILLLKWIAIEDLVKSL